MSDLVGNPEDRFSHNEAHLKARNTLKKKIEDSVELSRFMKSLGTRCGFILELFANSITDITFFAIRETFFLNRVFKHKIT